MSHPLHIAFVWHMHQPYYRDMFSGQCSMPWVRLHATKDYLDMVKILESYPAVHQTFNLVPSLIDQLEEYLPPQNRSDQFLDMSRKASADLTDAERRFVLEHFFMAHWDHMIKPYPRYHDLLAKRGPRLDEHTWPEVVKTFKAQDYLDLQVWFNLSWIDPWLRQQDGELTRLERKGSQFTEADKAVVLGKQLEILGQVVPAYREAQERGQVELSCSPYYHPIIPLVCDLHAAHAALPQMTLPPVSFYHPEDAQWHIVNGLARHEAVFGRRPQGMWPSEGSVSDELAGLVAQQKVQWIATDEEILWRTLRIAPSDQVLYRPHLIRRPEGEVTIIFRDRELSDLIGFVYSQWDASMAAADFVRRLEGIRERASQGPPALVSIILDGENAWEFYPQDAHNFFSALYQALSKDDRFRLVTVSEYLAQFPPDRNSALTGIFAGSWIDGNFATWIGHPEKNTAWSHLATVRDDLVQLQQAIDAQDPSLAKAWRSFYAAEGSDWEWWLGDTHSSAQDEEFDRLFRMHLANVYRFLGRPAPGWLEVPITTSMIQPLYEPSGRISPTIDGLETTYYEWLYAGRLDLRKGYGAAHRGVQILQALYYGIDAEQYYVRVDFDQERLSQLRGWRIVLEMLDRGAQIEILPSHEGGVTATLSGTQRESLPCALVRTLEVAVPKSALGLKPGESLQLRLSLYDGAESLERYPNQGAFQIFVPADDFESRMWSV